MISINGNLLAKAHIVCLIPLLWLIFDIVSNNLGANPIEALHIRLGDWSLRFLCITLAITPIQTITQWRGMSDYRRLFGLYTFFYASLHIFVYLAVDHALVWRMIAIDIIESPYIWFGLLSYIIILALALTTPKSAKKCLGKSWKKLHQLIYVAAVAAIIHYYWQLKGNLAEPFFYALLIGILLSFRVLTRLKKQQANKITLPKSKQVRPDLSEKSENLSDITNELN